MTLFVYFKLIAKEFRSPWPIQSEEVAPELKRLLYHPWSLICVWTIYESSLLTLCNEKLLFRSLNSHNAAHFDLLRLASAAAACRSWVDLLTGMPNRALWVTSLRMRRWPLFDAVFGEEGGVKDPDLLMPQPAVYRCRETGETILIIKEKSDPKHKISMTNW